MRVSEKKCKMMYRVKELVRNFLLKRPVSIVRRAAKDAGCIYMADDTIFHCCFVHTST